jgi:quercetin dioxygenase-like cupin family protein
MSEFPEFVKHPDYDEYMIVAEGCYTLIIDGQRIPLRRGEEYFIARGVHHSGEVVAGTRTIHAFAGHRADRAAPDDRQNRSGA